MAETHGSRSERVDLRMTPAAKRMLMQAAATENKTLSEFLIDRGLQAAFDTLGDRRDLVVDAERWQTFKEELDRPPTDNPALRQLLTRRPAWEA